MRRIHRQAADSARARGLSFEKAQAVGFAATEKAEQKARERR